MVASLSAAAFLQLLINAAASAITAEWSPLALAGVDCAEVSLPVADTGESWAILPPRPSSETCQAVFVAWFPAPASDAAAALAPAATATAATRVALLTIVASLFSASFLPPLTNAAASSLHAALPILALAGVDCAEVSLPVADTGESWAILPPRPSSETCQAVFVAWFPAPASDAAAALAPTATATAATMVASLTMVVPLSAAAFLQLLINAAAWSTVGLNGEAERSPLALAGVDCAEASLPFATPFRSWAILPPRPSSETCQAVFVAWFPAPASDAAAALAPTATAIAATMVASSPSAASLSAAAFLQLLINAAASAITAAMKFVRRQRT